MFFQNVGRLRDITTWQAAKLYLRKDLDAGPLTQWRVNLTYRASMRRTGIKGPSGQIMPVRNISVEMPQEDYSFVEQFGIKEFTDQLAAYRHKYALEQGWISAGEDAVPVNVWPSPRLKRLRPIVTFKMSRDGSTRTLTRSGMTRAADSTERFGVAWLTFKDQEWTLRPGEAPYRLGRSRDNHIVTVHPEISAHQADITYTGTEWTLVPARSTNPTHIDGKPVSAPAALRSGATITIGRSEPIRFDNGTSAKPDSA
ncbi:FHA domain-containing protein [Arthrobacter sp. KBS0703]|uniref:FHA domain-containing protein n=1 Tax=Arthrobacter sp. KBS0703 TaxID=1955698 RepID=UPI00163D6A91|nr:FHA domain-containing protein [Arthrobacter sp. KBS0703]